MLLWDISIRQKVCIRKTSCFPNTPHFIEKLKYLAQSAICTPTFCGVNGNCELSNNVAVCVCKPGFVGSRCQAVDPCAIRPCGANGACFPIIQSQVITNPSAPFEQVSYFCQCYSGFYGQNCEFGRYHNIITSAVKKKS